MVKFIIHSLNAEKDGKISKKYKLKQGLNIIQSQNTSQGKTTLIGIIDYCLNGKDVFPWMGITSKYDSVSMEVEIGDKFFLIRRGLVDDKQVKIFGMENFKTQINEDITDFILKEIGIKHYVIFSAGKQVKISIRDYLKLFFMRQLDTKNLAGDVFGFNKVVQAGKIALGLEEKGLVETRLKEVINEINSKENYLERLRADIGRGIEKVDLADLKVYENRLEKINLDLYSFEEKLNEGKDYKIPLISKIKGKEDVIREDERKLQKLKENLLNISILRKELLVDYETIQKSEIALEILKEFPDKKCPECNNEVEPANEPITCKLCGCKIEDRRDLISNFYKINKNLERDINMDEKRILGDIKDLEENIKHSKHEYNGLMNQLARIEESVILRFTNEIRSSLVERDQIIESIKEIKINLGYKNKLLIYVAELNTLQAKKSDLETELSQLQITLKRFEDHKELVKKYLSILNMSFSEIVWKNENIFPHIDKKGLGDHGGSDSVRVLSSVLSSLFELSLGDLEVKVPSVLIIDSLRKHEIELNELEALGKKWISIMKDKNAGQVILTGVEIPKYLVDEAKKNDTYYYIKNGQYTL